MNKTARGIIAVLVLMFFMAVPMVSQAGNDATPVLKSTIDEVIDVLRDASLKGADKTQARRAKLRESIAKRFSFEDMAKRSMGKYWKDLSKDERTEFVGIFGRLIENSYIEKIEAYTDEKVVYEDERQVKNTSMVKTKVITKTGTEIPIDYKLFKRNGAEWMVYDIVVEGVSLVRNYRTQFSKAMSGSSYAELVKDLKSKL